jgi:hypothetical protein
MVGISRVLMFQARKVIQEFDSPKKHPRVIEGGPRDGESVEMTLREYYEPRILRCMVGGEHEAARPMGLGAVLAGIEGDRQTPRQKPPSNQLELFATGLTGAFHQLKRLGIDALRTRLRAFVGEKAQTDEELELMEQLGDELRSAARARRKTLDKSEN